MANRPTVRRDGVEGPTYPIIDDYLAVLMRRLSWRRDRDYLLGEVADHLYCATDDRLREDGDREVAQRETIARFGEPMTVALAFATSTRGGLAMPTRLTRTAGVAGSAASLGWGAVGLALAVAGLLRVSGGPDAVFGFRVCVVTDFVLLPLTAVAVVGLLARAGHRVSGAWVVGAVILGIGSSVIGVVGWHVGAAFLAANLGVKLATVSVAAVALLRLRRSGDPLLGDWMLTWSLPAVIAGAAVGVGVGLLGDDALLGLYLGTAAAPILFGLGLFRRSRWLVAEPAVADGQRGPLDLRWATISAMALTLGLGAGVQVLGYVLLTAIGGTSFFWVDHPGPAFTAGIIAMAALTAALGTYRRAMQPRELDRCDGRAERAG